MSELDISREINMLKKKNEKLLVQGVISSIIGR